MLTVYLIRHARTPGNEQKKYIGVTDEPLSQGGRAELKTCAERGVYPPVDFVYVSPMRRCRETAEIIYPTAPQTIIPEFAECDFGVFEGKTYEQLKDNPLYRAFIASNGSADIKNGENTKQFRARSCLGFEMMVGDILRRGDQCAAAVLHGGTIMAILTRYAPEKKDFYEWQTRNCGGYCLAIEKSTWETGRQINAVEELRQRE
jgi:alpha-ribazole phosphatase